MHKDDLALGTLQGFMCRKTQSIKSYEFNI